MRSLITGFSVLIAIITSFVQPSLQYSDGWNEMTRAPNVGSISGTRHNLTMSYLSPIAGQSWITR